MRFNLTYSTVASQAHFSRTSSTLSPIPPSFQEEGFADTTSKEGRSPELLSLGKSFARLHGMSSATNLLVFLASIYQLYVLSSKHVTFGATSQPAVKAFFGW